MRVETALSKHFIYWILPSIITITSILLYYFNPLGLSKIIAPEFNREFGFIENFQLFLILAVIYIALKNTIKSNIKLEKLFFGFIAFCSFIIFLEEIDYGLHFYNLLKGKAYDTTTINIGGEDIRNLHNIGKTTSYIKLIVYIAIVLFFVLLPLISLKVKFEDKIVKYFTPSIYLALTVVAMFVVNQFALSMEAHFATDNHALKSNVSEFEEVFIYYIALLFTRELSLKEFPYNTPQIN